MYFRCLERLLEQWTPLAQLFHDEKKKLDEKKKKLDEKKKTQKKSESQQQDSGEKDSARKVEAIYEFLRSRTSRLYCRFLLYTSKVFDQVCCLQTESSKVWNNLVE